MKFLAPSLILACGLLVVEAGVLGAIGAQEGDDTPKSILKTILTKDGALGDIFGGGLRAGRSQRRGRILDQLGGGGDGDFAGVIVSLAQDIIGAIKTAKLELLGNLVGNVGGGNGPLGLGLLRGLGGSSRSASGGEGPTFPILGSLRGGTGSGAAGGGLGQIVQTVSDLKQGLFDKESGALSGLLGGGEGGLGNPIQEAKSLLGEGLGGLVSADSSRSGRRIHNIALPFSNSHREGGLMQHSMCTFFCMTSRNKSVQESCLKRNRCNGREDTSRVVNDDLEAVIRELEIEDEEER